MGTPFEASHALGPVALDVEAGTVMNRTPSVNASWQPRSTQKILDALAAQEGGDSVEKGDTALTRVIHVTLEWRDLTYKVTIGKRRKKTDKTILRDLTSAVPAGRLLAVMGPTGSGKTSLLNALAGRLPRGGNLEGEILVNGIPRGKGFRTISTYVMQDDVLFHNLTVRETFEFAAKMRLPASIPAEQRAALVTSIITELGLVKAENTYVGNAFVRGVSGGERKRCNIGIEIISNPSLIFLDEPTSGLDAFQAQNVMESLWHLARGGRTIVSTIHQPRSSIYKMFDLLMLLSEGRTIYAGPAAQAVGYFERCGYPCPSHFNPADFFLDVVSMDHRSPAAEEATRKRIADLAERYLLEGTGYLDEPIKISPEDGEAMRDVNDYPGFPNSVPVEFGLLLRRAWKQQSRDRMPMIINIVQTLLIGFVLAALYSKMQMNQTGISDETGVLFFISVFGAMSALFGSVTSFQVERGVVNRERAGKAYHVLPYYLARSICDLPVRVGQGLLFGVIVYWIVGLNPSAKAFFIFVAILILEGLSAQALGVAISASCDSEKSAMALAPAVTVVLMLFGGFYVNEGTIPAAIRWIRYLSHLYWTFMALALNDFSGREGWSCDDAVATGCITTGDQILDRLGFSSNHMWQPVLGLVCLLVGFNTIGYLLLRFRKPRFLPLSPAPKKA